MTRPDHANEINKGTAPAELPGIGSGSHMIGGTMQ